MKELIDLINSLNPSEKRYFKIYTKKHIIGGQNKYILLFDLVCVHKKEEVIIKNLKKTHYSNKNISADISYLYKIILNALNEFNKNATITLKVNSNLSSIEILFYKGLYSQALKLIKKSKNLLQKIDDNFLLISVLKWEKKCSGYAFGLEAAQNVNNEIVVSNTINKSTTKIVNEYYKIYRYLTTNNEITEDEYAHINKIIEDISLEKNDTQTTIESNVFKHLIFAYYNRLNKNKEQEIYYFQKLIDYIGKHPTYTNENPMDFITIFFKYLHLIVDVSEESYLFELDRFHRLSNTATFQKEIIKHRVQFHILILKIEYNLHHKNTIDSYKRALELEELLYNNNYKIEDFHTIYARYLIAYIYFQHNEKSKCISFLNYINNHYDVNVNSYYIFRTRMLLIIHHFEKGDYDFTYSLIKKLNYKKVNKKYLKNERLIIDGIKKIIKNDSSKNVFSNLYKELDWEKNYNDFIENNINEFYINYVKKSAFISEPTSV